MNGIPFEYRTVRTEDGKDITNKLFPLRGLPPKTTLLLQKNSKVIDITIVLPPGKCPISKRREIWANMRFLQGLARSSHSSSLCISVLNETVKELKRKIEEYLGVFSDTFKLVCGVSIPLIEWDADNSLWSFRFSSGHCSGRQWSNLCQMWCSEWFFHKCRIYYPNGEASCYLICSQETEAQTRGMCAPRWIDSEEVWNSFNFLTLDPVSLFYCLAISCYAKDYEFRLGNTRLDESGTWASCAIENGTIINLIPKDTSIQIFCKTLTGHFRFHLHFYFTCTSLISSVLLDKQARQSLWKQAHANSLRLLRGKSKIKKVFLDEIFFQTEIHFC